MYETDIYTKIETPEKESTSTRKTNHNTLKGRGTKGTELWIALGVMLEMFDLFLIMGS